MKALALLSGGMDSAVAYELACEKRDPENVQPLFFFYRQKTAGKEYRCSKLIAEKKGAKLISITMELSHLSSDLIVGGGGKKYEGLPSTFVPGRNIIQLAYAGSYAKEYDYEEIYGGWTQQDWSGYPDCTGEFLKDMEWALRHGLDHGFLRIVHPVLNFRKHETVRIGKMLGVPFEHTWSCYTREDKPCMECDSCKLRAAAFKEAEMEDPIL